MRFTSVMAEIAELADKAGLPVDKFCKAATVLEEKQAALDKARQSQPEEKELIYKAIEEMDGHLSVDTPVSDILARAGVRSVQGTRSVATRGVKQYLLTHVKA